MGVEPNVVGAFVAGLFLGFVLGKLLDPPPPEVVEAIAKSEWARRLAEAYVNPDLPPQERERLINEVARKLAERVASRLWV